MTLPGFEPRFRLGRLLGAAATSLTTHVLALVRQIEWRLTRANAVVWRRA